MGARVPRLLVVPESLHWVMRFGQMWAAFGLGAVVLCACGGTTRHDDDANDTHAGADMGPAEGGQGGTADNSRGGAAGSAAAGAEPTIPTFQGVPIGDCRAPTDATRSAGCPAEPPAESSPCEAPDGLKQCAYDLQVSEGRAIQRVYNCHPDQLTWGSFYVPCGMVCSTLSGGVVELDTSCGERELVSCRNTDSTFAFETEQQWLDNAFEHVLASCLGEARYNRQFQLEVAGGCGTRLSSDAPFSADAAACLKKALDSARWECGLRLSCTTFAAYFL